MLLKLKGITLVETLVYLALFGIIFTVMVEFSISIAQSNRSAELRQHLDRAKTFIIEHIDNSFLDTNSIDLNNSVFNNDQGKVRLNNLGYFEYYLENGVLKFNNTGTVYFEPKGTIEVTSIFGKKMANIEVAGNVVLPTGMRTIEAVWPKPLWLLGIYKAHLAINVTGKGDIATKNLTFYAFM